MKGFSPFPIAVAGMAIALVWSYGQTSMLVARESRPLPVMAKAEKTGTVQHQVN